MFYYPFTVCVFMAVCLHPWPLTTVEYNPRCISDDWLWHIGSEFRNANIIGLSATHEFHRMPVSTFTDEGGTSWIRWGDCADSAAGLALDLQKRSCRLKHVKHIYGNFPRFLRGRIGPSRIKTRTIDATIILVYFPVNDESSRQRK